VTEAGELIAVVDDGETVIYQLKEDHPNFLLSSYSDGSQKITFTGELAESTVVTLILLV
jgi:hypothetical protein